jgi:hypothetical protein
VYETRTRDALGQLLAAHPSVPEAFLGAVRLAGTVDEQLGANGEGHGDFRVDLAIRDVRTGADIGWSATVIPARAPTRSGRRIGHRDGG